MMVNSALDTLKARGFFTPDAKELEQYNRHVLFVWDSFKLSFPHEKALAHTAYLGEATTLDKNFVMKVCPTFPIIFQTAKDEEVRMSAVPVLGEAYSVGLHDIFRLDALMDNHGSFYRKKRYIRYIDQEWPGVNKERQVVTEAWMYIATPHFKTEIEASLQTGTQVRDNGKLYWSWLRQNMRPVN